MRDYLILPTIFGKFICPYSYGATDQVVSDKGMLNDKDTIERLDFAGYIACP